MNRIDRRGTLLAAGGFHADPSCTDERFEQGYKHEINDDRRREDDGPAEGLDTGPHGPGTTAPRPENGKPQGPERTGWEVRHLGMIAMERDEQIGGCKVTFAYGRTAIRSTHDDEVCPGSCHGD